jgi:hypothetical protein
MAGREGERAGATRTGKTLGRRTSGTIADRIMEAVYFTLAAIVLYFVSDRILERIEVARGARLEHRSLIFFGILLVLALTTFTAIRQLSG